MISRISSLPLNDICSTSKSQILKSRAGFQYVKCFQSSNLNIKSDPKQSRGNSKYLERKYINLEKLELSAKENSHIFDSVRETVAIGLTAFSLTIALYTQPANAADAVKTCLCLLRECKTEFINCFEDPKCAANIACLNTCNGRPDETECQIGCGDLFEDPTVDAFNRCAITSNNCVPQKKDQGLFPVPPTSALVQQFDTSKFEGPWYISSGLNPSFDIFDCQLHEFSTGPGTIVGQLTWRIRTPDGGFFTRNAEQRFVQDPKNPGILYNHDNEMLHYQDDWYILSAKTEGSPDDYVLVYYRGTNDAWDGYGGAVLYTRARTVPASIVPELESSLKSIGFDYSKFTPTDNSCPPPLPLLARLEKKVEAELVKGEKGLEKIGKNILEISQTEIELFNQLGKGAEEFTKDKDIFFKEIGEEEQILLGKMKLEPEDVEDLFGNALPIRRRR